MKSTAPRAPSSPPESPFTAVAPGGSRRLVGRILRGAGLALAAFAGGAAVTALQGGALGTARATGPAESPYQVMGQLGRVLATIEREYVEPADRAKLLGGAIEGMVSALDPHSSYMSPEDFTIFRSDLEGEFGGVGIEVDLRGAVMTVISPIEGSPAARADVRSGDQVLAVNGEATQGADLEKFVRKMRGAPGTHVRLTLKREGVTAPINVDLVRAIIRVHSVDAKLLRGDVAFIRIKQFQERTHDELLTQVGRLRKEAKGQLTGLVLDLRTDPGGFVDEASAVADELLGSGTIYTVRHRGQVVDEVTARVGGALVDLPTAVLVNEWTASASEIVAGALQDQKRAVIVGTRTFGKGSVQSIFELPGGAGMRLTTQRYYTPSGRAIQAEGVHPDIVVERPAQDGALAPLREGDLEGHLAAEQRGDAGLPAAPVKVEAAGGAVGVGDAGVKSPGERESSEEAIAHIPVDPERGDDPVLRAGYLAVRAHAPTSK